MTSSASVSSTQSEEQLRQKLQRRRQLHLLQAVWRSLLVGSMAGGLFWIITLPGWVIRQPEQIEIEGNKIVSTSAILTRLPLSYPQSLLQIKPQQLSDQLESTGAIAQATVTRQLLPPRMLIEVKERKPVAVALPGVPKSQNSWKAVGKVGFIDQQGVWVSKSSYQALEANFEIPKLRVIGVDAKILPYWSEIYQAIRLSTVKISEIDWHDSANLILKTELGNVQIGPYTSHFQEQLAVLASMKKLPTQINARQIDYLDLKDPQSPLIQLKKEQIQTP